MLIPPLAPHPPKVCALALFVLATLFFCCFNTPQSWAQDFADDPFEYDTDVGVVGRKNFNPENRFDFTLYGGGNFFNILISDYMLGGGIRYNFYDWLGVETRGLYHVFSTTSSGLLAEANATAAARRSFYIDFIQLESLVHVVFSPMYGKHHMWGTTFVNYQLYFFAGPDLLSLNQVITQRNPHAFSYGVSFGGGFKFYVSEMFNVVIEIRDLTYMDKSFDDSQLSSQFAITLGVGVTLPAFEQPKRKI